MNYKNKEKYIGILTAAAIGDALGWPNEQNSRNVSKNISNLKNFITWSRKCGGRYWPYEEKIMAGNYSDDTQLLIATIRSLLRGKQWSNYFRQVELPVWLNYERGGGGATKRAAKKWALNISPWDESDNTPIEIRRYYLAGGNGAVMRISPHVFGNEEDTEKIMFQVVLNGMYTHGHPRALIGAMLYACAIRRILIHTKILEYGELINLLINEKNTWGKLPNINKIDIWKKEAHKYAGYEYDTEWNTCVEETLKYLETVRDALQLGILDIGNDTLEKLGCFNAKINGAGNLTAVISIYLFSKYADNPAMALYETANLKHSDTDTLTSMVGGLLGALHGCDWIPIELRNVQDSELFEYLVKQLDNEKCDFLDDQKQYRLFGNDQFSNLSVGESVECLPFGELTLKEIRDEKVYNKDMYAKTYVWKTNYGQTVFSKKIGKLNKVNSDIEYKEKNKNLNISKAKLDSIRDNLKVVTNLNDFVEILGAIMELNDKTDIQSKNIDELKKKWKKYKLTKKQILSIYNLLSQ